MVTLLLTFFVVMLSMSTIEVEKFDALVRSLNPGSDKGTADKGESTFLIEDPQDGMSMDTLFQLIAERIQESDMQDSISIEKQDGVIFIRFSSHMLFEPDRFNMLQESKPLMEFIGSALKLYEDKIKTINICGHTARTGRINSDVSDWRLSGERAATVAMFFEDYARFDKNKMITFGYGDNYPIADNSTEPGRRLNRRVEIVVVGMESMANFDVYGVLYGTFEENGTGGDILTPVLPENVAEY
jgi:chemotaxis protein MotB